VTLHAALAGLVIASATCGARPDPWVVDAPRLDGGQDFDGGLPDGGFALDCRPCEHWGEVEVMGPLPLVLDELSGLAASAKLPGVI